MTGGSSILTQAPAAQGVPGGYSPMTARMLGEMTVGVNRPLTHEQQALVGITRPAGSGRQPSFGTLHLSARSSPVIRRPVAQSGPVIHSVRFGRLRCICRKAV